MDIEIEVQGMGGFSYLWEQVLDRDAWLNMVRSSPRNGGVKDMLDPVKDEAKRIDVHVLKAACSEGVFLQEILRRKLATAHARYIKNDFERLR